MSSGSSWNKKSNQSANAKEEYEIFKNQFVNKETQLVNNLPYSQEALQQYAEKKRQWQEKILVNKKNYKNTKDYYIV